MRKSDQINAAKFKLIKLIYNHTMDARIHELVRFIIFFDWFFLISQMK